MLTGRIDDNGNTTSYAYDALDRWMRTIYADGTQRSATYDVHDNQLTLIDGNGSVSTGTYDLLDRLTNKTITPGAGVSDDTTFEGYAYDGLSRLVRAEDDDSVITFTYDSLSNVTGEILNGQTIACVYDGVGNRVSVTGGSQHGIYAMDDSTPIPADHQMNQYTTTPFDARLYDENGNLVTVDGGLSTLWNLSFDYRDQLVECIGTQRYTYAYDVFGRRIVRVVDADDTPQETRYFYDGWRVCEEQDARGATQATYVYGLYIDEVLNMRRGGQDYYYHADDLYNVMAVKSTYKVYLYAIKFLYQQTLGRQWRLRKNLQLSV